MTHDVPWQDGDVYEAYHALCSRANVYLASDGTGEIYVNGVGVDLLNTDMRFGQEKGEIEGWFDCRLVSFSTGASLRPQGTISVEMPLRYRDAPLQAEQPAPLSFIMDVGDAASRYAVALPAPESIREGVTARFTDLHFSPVTVWIDLEADVSASALPREIGPLDDNQLDAVAESCFPEFYYINFHLENSRGEALGRFRDGFVRVIAREGGGMTFLLHLEFAPSSQYTDTVYLVQDDVRLPIPLNTARP